MSNDEEKYWQGKIKEHWKVVAVFIAAVIVAFISALVVLRVYIDTSPIGLQGTAPISLWTLDWVVGFLIQYVGWTLLLVGVPFVLFCVVGGYLVWSSLPDEEKQEFKDRDKKYKSRRRKEYGGGGGGSFIIFIGYCLLHLIRGTNDLPFGAITYTYWIYSWLETLMWMFIVLGIPVLVAATIYYFVKVRKKSE